MKKKKSNQIKPSKQRGAIHNIFMYVDNQCITLKMVTLVILLLALDYFKIVFSEACIISR